MTEEVVLQGGACGQDPLRVVLRRSKQARRMSLRVSALDGRATLTVPYKTPDRIARQFVEDKSTWLRHHMGGVAPVIVPQIGATLPFEGRERRIVGRAGLRAPRLDGAQLLVPEEGGNLPTRLAAFLREEARVRAVAACDRYSAALGRPYAQIALRDTRSRWGSCSQAGRLMFSWRLILAPSEVLDYVAAHEVAHLEQMNHSPAFWAVVAELCPRYEAPRAWLKGEGAGLHRWQFKTPEGS